MKNHFSRRMGYWFVERLIHIPERDRKFTLWMMIALGIATTASATIYALGNPVGASFSSHALNIGKMVSINALLFLVWTIIAGTLFSFIYLPLPRLLMASLSYTIASSIYILLNENTGKLFSYIIGVGYSLVVMIIGLIVFMFFHRKVHNSIKIAFIITIIALSSVYMFIDQTEIHHSSVPALAMQADKIQDENPGTKGDYDYSFFTYGSGQDLHREEFGATVDQNTPSVDASHFIDKWSTDREKFWGFDPSDLPVNGRLWLPEGQGDFPIILMVHGNHTMEYFSTSGYDYLGELLASRGFIAVSVDEDFINYSNAYGAPNDNYELRAWMLLQHLEHLQQMNSNPESPFYQQIDFDQVALMGHSRGGQAALMAADYKSFFNDEKLLESMDNVHIQAVIAIAPTDNKVDGKYPSIHNTSYLLLHGARDADVYDYRGDQQFYRATFDKNYDGFKTTLYIADANHTQFNTNWGSMDLSLPRGLFLNRKQTMEPEDQQQIAKVYLSAFLERVFHENTSYEKLFQDYRYGKDWLPDTIYVNKYRPASYKPIQTYRQYNQETFDVDGFSAWEISKPKDRRGRDQSQNALKLEWENDASYSIDVSNVDLSTNEQIVLTMANIDAEAEYEDVPEIQIELQTADGISVQLPLNEFMPFPPVIKTDYTHFGLFDNIFRDGRYDTSWEPIFQTFEIPIEAYERANVNFNGEKINNMTIHFTSQPGKIYIEEIGVW